MDFPGGSVGKNLPANAGDMDSIFHGKTPHAAERLSPHATAELCSGAQAAQLLSPRAARTVPGSLRPAAGEPPQGEATQRSRESALLTAAKEKPRGHEGSAQPK